MPDRIASDSDQPHRTDACNVVRALPDTGAVAPMSAVGARLSRRVRTRYGGVMATCSGVTAATGQDGRPLLIRHGRACPRPTLEVA